MRIDKIDESDVLVVALTNDKETYIFFYEESTRMEICETLRRFAADPELNFTWSDATRLIQHVESAGTFRSE